MQFLTRHVFMVRPDQFGFNAETGTSNRFQQALALPQEDITTRAHAEFEGLVEVLKEAGVEVQVFSAPKDKTAPDAVFPNNWISTHAMGEVVLYPMQAQNRRVERQPDILEYLKKHYHVSAVIDWSDFEQQGQFLEGTGSLVLDRTERVAYACLSSRTHIELIELFAKQFGYELISFAAADEANIAIYHTNVLMSVAPEFVLVCMEAVAPGDRSRLQQAIAQTSKTEIQISIAQMRHFLGNALALRGGEGETLLVMSKRAEQALLPTQRHIIEQSARIISASVELIEQLGGGSVRCMLAENFLPKATTEGVNAPEAND